MQSTARLLLGLMILLAACATNSRTSTLQHSHIGSKYARQTGYFAACGTMCIEEQTVEAIRHEAVRDEATLMMMGNTETCIDLVVRTASGADEPFDQLNPVCMMGGNAVPTVVESEAVSVRDWDYTGEVETLRVEAVTQTNFLGLSMSEPQEKTFRVIERTGRICCGSGPAWDVSLAMRNHSFDVGASPGKLRFDWKIAQ